MATKAQPRHTLSYQLREIIDSRGLTAYAVGQMAEVDPGMVSRFLTGERDIRLGTADKLAVALGVRLTELSRPPAVRKPARLAKATRFLDVDRAARPEPVEAPDSPIGQMAEPSPVPVGVDQIETIGIEPDPLGRLAEPAGARAGANPIGANGIEPNSIGQPADPGVPPASPSQGPLADSVGSRTGHPGPQEAGHPDPPEVATIRQAGPNQKAPDVPDAPTFAMA